MPRKKRNGSRSDSPEKPQHLGCATAHTSQYGSNGTGKSGDVVASSTSGDPHKCNRSEKDANFQYLQDIFRGQVDADVVYVILSECDWKVEDAVEKLLQLADNSPVAQSLSQGPSLKSVPVDLKATSTMAADRGQNPAPRQDLALNLRSRLPSAHSSDQAVGALPMLSPRTPSVAGIDFPVFPNGGERPSSIQTALEALESFANTCNDYTNRDLSSFIKSCEATNNNIFNSHSNSSSIQNESAFGLPTSPQDCSDFQLPTSEESMERLSGMPVLSHFNSPDSQVPISDIRDIFPHSFQPIQTMSPPVLTTSSLASSGNCGSMGGAGMGSCQEPVSPRTAFNSVIVGESARPLLNTETRRPVREDSKESAASEVSHTSDVSHMSEESVVDLSPSLPPRRHHKQVLRRQNISLDPQERESLEQLIEEVLIVGVDEGVIDSDDSDTTDDEDAVDEDGHRIKRVSRSEGGTKVPPSQLKVAAKHMKNLPPRFQRRLQALQPGTTTSDGEVEGEERDAEEAQVKPAEEKTKRTKRKLKGLLNSLESYVVDDVIITDTDSDEEPAHTSEYGDAPITTSGPGAPSNASLFPLSPVVAPEGPSVSITTQAPVSPLTPTTSTTRPPLQQPIILRPNVVNYNELDLDRVVHTPPRPQLPPGSGHSSRDHTPEPRSRHDQHLQQQQQQQAARFSLDAPEFVPRSFHPINPPQAPGVASPVSHLREAYVPPVSFSYSHSGSPYTVHSASSPYQGRSGSPYHLGRASNMSPQMARRTLTGSPIAVMSVAPTGRHSPIPPAFFIPKAPPTGAAVATAAMHSHSSLLHYPAYPGLAHYQVHPSLRFGLPSNFRPPFMPPGTTASPRPSSHFKHSSSKDRLYMPTRPGSAPTLVPGVTSPRMAANLQPQTVQSSGKSPGTSKASPSRSNGEQGDSWLDKDGKEAKNLSTQGSRTSRSSTEDEVSPQEKVKAILEQGKKLMVILRGVPGSGKTHLAKELVSSGVILSTDDFFITSRGYEFDYAKIGEAHDWNQKKAKQAVDDGLNPIIIDNTNTQGWEMKYYILLALKHQYEVEIIEPDTPWKFRAKELAKRNKHGVSKENIQRMIDRYEHDVTIESIALTSDQIKAEVEKRQKLTVQQQQEQQQQQQQQPAPDQTTGQSDSAPTEERKTKKKTRRGKGRKKKARLREQRVAEALKEGREKTGDEASSDEENADANNSNTKGVPPPKQESKPSLATASLVAQVTEALAETAIADASQKPTLDEKEASVQSAYAPASDKTCQRSSSSLEDVDKEEQSVPEKDHQLEQKEQPRKDGQKQLTPETRPKATTVNRDEDRRSDASSDSSRDSVSEPGTVESQLSTDSGEDQMTGSSKKQKPTLETAKADTDEDALRDRNLLQIVMNSLEMNLALMLRTRSGFERAHLQRLLAKYRTSPEVRAEIEDIIKEKMFEGMVNKEVADITSNAEMLGSQAGSGSGADQQENSLTATDLSSIMNVLGQITQADDSASESDNDTNNNSTSGRGESTQAESAEVYEVASSGKAMNTEASALTATEKDLVALEKAYWQTDKTTSDQYSIGLVGLKPRLMSHPSWSDSSSEAPRESRQKPRRERRRPYNKPAKNSAEAFWGTLGHTNSHEQGEVDGEEADTSSGPTTPQTPSTPEHSGGQRRLRRLSGHGRLAVQFPLPELASDTQQQLPVTADWQPPDFSTKKVPFTAPAGHSSRPKIDVETFTHPKDFAVVERLKQQDVKLLATQEAALAESFLSVRNAVPRFLCEHATDDDQTNGTIPDSFMIHQSCSTEELEDQMRPSGVEFLQACFSGVPVEDLTDFLDRCKGDVAWAANLLLDAGYDCSDGSKQVPPQQMSAADQPDQVVVNESNQQAATTHVMISPISAFGFKSARPASESEEGATAAVAKRPAPPEVITTAPSPPPLTQLCHQSLPHPSSTLTHTMQEKFVETNVRRCSSITEFHQQHSLEKQSTVNSITSESPDCDVFYSPLEGPTSPSFPVSETVTVLEPETRQAQAQASVEAARSQTAEEDLELNLPLDLAQKLMAMFGPVGFHISADSLDPEDLRVQLTRKTARQLHRRWALTFQKKFSSEEAAIQKMIQQDEEYAKKLQAEEDKLQEQDAWIGVTGTGNRPKSLKEIMDEEQAMESTKFRKEQLETALGGDGVQDANSLATKMKRQELRQMFPSVDPQSLEEVYKTTGYNMTKTVLIIREGFDIDEPVKNVWTPEAIQAHEEHLLQTALELSLRDQWLGASDMQGDEEDYSPVQVLEDPAYVDLRAEASTHYRLRHECFRKAQEQYQRGNKQVASFFSQQGHLHTEKLRAANKRAAMKILELRNLDIEQTNTVDLHGLHVDEALRVLHNLIVRRERELRQHPDKRRRHLFVVTGRGNHSQGGRAKIRPAVIEFLTRKNYSFTEDIPGKLKVGMKYRDDLTLSSIP